MYLTVPRCVLKEPVASTTIVHKHHHSQGKPIKTIQVDIQERTNEENV